MSARSAFCVLRQVKPAHLLEVLAPLQGSSGSFLVRGDAVVIFFFFLLFLHFLFDLLETGSLDAGDNNVCDGDSASQFLTPSPGEHRVSTHPRVRSHTEHHLQTLARSRACSSSS